MLDKEKETECLISNPYKHCSFPECDHKCGYKPDEDDKKVFKATLIKYNTVNSNGRIYTEEALDKAFNDKQFQEMLNNNCLFGELNPTYDRPVEKLDPNTAAIITTKIEKDTDNNCYNGEIQILNNSNGQQLQSILDNKLQAGIALRGTSDDVKVDSRYNTIINQLNITSFDVVQNPAFESCIINKE